MHEGAAAPSHKTKQRIGIICASVGRFCVFPDYWCFGASSPCLYAGGYYNQNLDYGAFCVDYTNASNANANIGCRHLAYLG